MAKYKVVGKCSVLTKRGVAYPNGVFDEKDIVNQEQLEKLLKAKKIELFGKAGKPAKPAKKANQTDATTNTLKPAEAGTTDAK